MFAITPEQYNDFGKTSYINWSNIPKTVCVGSVGQYRWEGLGRMLCLGLGPLGFNCLKI